MAVAPYKDTMKRFLGTPREKTYTFLGVTLIVVLVLLLGAVRPTLTTISKLRGEIKERQNVNNQMQDKLNTLQEVQDDYFQKEEDLEFIQIFYPKDADYSLLMANFERIAKSYGYDLLSVRLEAARVEDWEVEESSEYPGMEVVESRIHVVGELSELVNLLEHLENLPSVPDVNRVIFNPVEDEGVVQIDVIISMTMYKEVSDSNLSDN